MLKSIRNKTTSAGYGIILFASVLYGTYGVWSRLMGDNFSPFYQAWVRSIVIMLIMIPFMLLTKSFRKIDRKDWLALAIFIGFCIFTQVPLYYAFNHASIGAVQLIFYSMFVITAYVMGKIYLGETIGKIKLVSMAIAFVGLALVFGNAVLIFAPLGLGLALLNGVASGAENASSKKLSNKYPPSLIIFWGWFFTLLTHLPISLLIGEPQVEIQFNSAWGWLLVYSVINASAFYLGILGFSMVDATIGSLIGLTEVIFAVIFGAILFNEVLSWGVYVGGVLILIAAMLPDLFNLLKHNKTKTPIQPITGM